MRTGTRRALTLGAGWLLLAGCAVAGPRGTAEAPVAPPPLPAAPTTPTTPPSSARSVPTDRSLGVVWHGRQGAEQAELAWLDPVTLRPRPGRRLALGQHGAGWAVAPDQSLALFAGGGDGDDRKLLVVDPLRLRNLGTIALEEGWEWQYASSWLGPSRVILAGGGATNGPEGVANAVVVTTVDARARRVLTQRTVPGELLASGRLPDGLVLLLGQARGIGPARVAVVDGGGTIRMVTLPRIAAGFQEPTDWNQTGASSRRAQPGLAVDPAGRRAFVVAADAQVAEVDLAGMTVAWHAPASRLGPLGRLSQWLAPAAEAKSVHGPVRLATWLGDGLLAVWGHDDTEPVARGQSVEQWRRPAGLQLIDTRTWTATTIDRNASGAVLAGGRLLTFGRLAGPPANPQADPNALTLRGYGLTVFGPGDRGPMHFFGSRQVLWLQVSGDRAYADLTPSTEWFASTDPFTDNRVVGVVDLASGRVVAEWRGRLPQLLVGGCCDQPSGW